MRRRVLATDFLGVLDVVPALPMKIRGGSGGPVRIVAVRNP
jgi:kynurenine formamidase